MGNKPARKMGRQPYNQMVEDAISALKERPGSSQTDIIQYLEAKYEKKISPRNKKNLETVMRSVLKSQPRGGGRQPMRGGRSRGGFKAKGGPRRKFGRSLPRGLPARGRVRNISRQVGPILKKKAPKPHMAALKGPGKKSLVTPGWKAGGHQRQQLLRRAKRGTTMRGRKLLLGRTSPVGSMSAMSIPTRRGRRN